VTLAINDILDIVVTHAQNTGWFQSVTEYESKQSGTNGLTAGVWVESVVPVKSSGLSNVSVRLELQMRLYGSTMAEPYDDIDANLTKAVDDLFTAYIGDFDLGSNVRHIDIFGAHGNPLSVRVGYMNMDGREFRVFQIVLPIIINDVWAESP
jgi:hypothetical protein